MGAAEPGSEELGRPAIFSMRAKVATAGLCFTTCMVLAASLGMPHLIAALQGLRGTDRISQDQPVVIGLGSLQQALLDPTDHLLATCSDTSIQIWGLNGSLISTMPAKYGTPWAGFDWSPDGTMIAATDFTGRITVAHIHNLSDTVLMYHDYSPSTVIGGGNVEPWPVKWSPQGNLLALAYVSATYIYNIPQQRCVATLLETGPRGRPGSIDWSPDGSRLTVAGNNSTLVYDASTWQIADSLAAEEDTHHHSDLSAFSPDGTRVAIFRQRLVWFNESVGDLEFYLIVCDSADGAVKASTRIGEVHRDTALAWSPDGGLIAVSTGSSLLVFRSADVALVSNISAYSSAVSLSWVGSHLASASRDQMVRLWRWNPAAATPSFEVIRTLQGWGSIVDSVEWSPDGENLVVGHEAGNAPTTYRVDAAGVEVVDAGSPGQAGISPDGKMVAKIDGSEVSILDSKHGALAARLDAGQAVRSFMWNPQRSGVLAVVGDDWLQIWSLADTNKPAGKVAFGGLLRVVEWSPWSSLLAVGLDSDVDLLPSTEGAGRVEVWDPWRPTLLASAATREVVFSLEWSCDETYLACWTGWHPEAEYERDNLPGLGLFYAALTVWYVPGGADPANFSLVGSVVVPRTMSGPGSISWAPNSTMIAGVTGYQTGDKKVVNDEAGICTPGIAVWRVDDIAGLIPMARLTGPIRSASCVDWSPDGSRIAAGFWDGTVWIWKVGPEKSAPVVVVGGPLPALLAVMMLAVVIDLLKPHIRRRDRT